MSAAFEPTRMQQLILAGQRLLPESPLYNMAFSFELVDLSTSLASKPPFGA